MIRLINQFLEKAISRITGTDLTLSDILSTFLKWLPGEQGASY